MKPDWCDEATWERAKGVFILEPATPHYVIADVARALIAAKNEGLEEACAILQQERDETENQPHYFILGEGIEAIRSRIQKEVP